MNHSTRDHDRVYIVRESDGVIYGLDKHGFGNWGGTPLVLSRRVAVKMLHGSLSTYDGTKVRLTHA